MSHPWQHYVALGDSFTAGAGDAVAGVAPQGAADQLAAALRTAHPTLRYDNLARPNLTSSEICKQQLETALQLQPDLVSIVAGANDILGRAWHPERFENELHVMFEAFVNTGATLITATLPHFPILSRLPVPVALRLQRNRTNANSTVQRLAGEYGAVCLDMASYSLPFNPVQWSADGIHPSPLGYCEIASRLISHIERQVGVKILDDVQATSATGS
jgi:lysophospholipase L1-like esterase